MGIHVKVLTACVIVIAFLVSAIAFYHSKDWSARRKGELHCINLMKGQMHSPIVNVRVRRGQKTIVLDSSDNLWSFESALKDAFAISVSTPVADKRIAELQTVSDQTI